MTAEETWHPTLLWYAKAVGAMKNRALSDPTSWRYQSAIHEYIRSPEADPFFDPAEALPSQSDQDRFWNQCQHFSWYFLPWHRAYLAMFEETVAATVHQLGGPPDWSLPYWNYSDARNPQARELPPVFLAGTLPDGNPNALRVDARLIDSSTGNVSLTDDDVRLAECLSEAQFDSTLFANQTSFGGPRTTFNHDTAIAMGTVDRVPHGAVHMAVNGWMAGFNTAPLDPVFWLHHANIDRLWTIWLARDAAHKNPAANDFLMKIPFAFNGAAGNVVSFVPKQVLDTRSMSSPYQYEDESDPLAGFIEAVEIPEAVAMTDRNSEMIGATQGPVLLIGEAVSTSVDLSAPTGPVSESAEATALAETYLNIENITGSGRAMSYRVYVNVPPGDDADAHPELLAGVLPMFGLSESSRSASAHSGNGLHYVLRIGQIVRRLQTRNDWDRAAIRVTFVPIRRGVQRESVGESVERADPIRVGRVSVYIG
jgi:tyrosinase